MSDELLLGIDLGTGSVRAVLFTPDGRQIAAALREWTHRSVPGVPGSQDFDTAAGWDLICVCVREALAAGAVSAGQVAAVSATAMREGMVLYDAAGAELWACPNVDSRADVQARALVDSGAADRIYATAGDWVSITAPARFRWLAEHRPDVMSRAAHLGMLSDWVVTRLTGEFVTDPTVGSSSALFDLAHRSWSRELLELVGVDPSIVPPVLECGSPVGGVTATAAAATGLRPGTPVVLGGADTQLGLIGLADGHRGSVTVVGGTFWQTTAVVDHALIDPERRLRTLCHALPGQWMLEGIGFFCGTSMRWMRDAFCELEREQAHRRRVDAYQVMEEAAAAVPPGANGVVGVFSNVMQASRWVHSTPAFLQLDITAPDKTNRAAFIRAVQEAAGYATRAHLDIVQDVTDTPVTEVILTGGAAKGSLWPQIVADILGRPVGVPRVKESTALGAALLASVAVRLHPDLAAATRAAVHFERTFEPDPVAVGVYEQLFAQWRDLYPRMLQLTEQTGLTPLWWPAGA